MGWGSGRGCAGDAHPRAGPQPCQRDEPHAFARERRLGDASCRVPLWGRTGRASRGQPRPLPRSPCAPQPPPAAQRRWRAAQLQRRAPPAPPAALLTARCLRWRSAAARPRLGCRPAKPRVSGRVGPPGQALATQRLCHRVRLWPLLEAEEDAWVVLRTCCIGIRCCMGSGSRYEEGARAGGGSASRAGPGDPIWPPGPNGCSRTTPMHVRRLLGR
jgi:hypothetical protein